MLNWLFGGEIRESKLKKELAHTKQQLHETTKSHTKAIDEIQGLKREIMALKGQKRQTGALHEDARPLAPETPYLKTPAPVTQKSKQLQTAANTSPTGRGKPKHTTEHHYHNGDGDGLLVGVLAGSMLAGNDRGSCEQETETATGSGYGDTGGNDACGGGDDGGCD